MRRGRAQRCAEKVLMSACTGKVVRDGVQWHCLDCGCSSTSWGTQHQPLQTRAAHFLSSYADLLREVDEQETVVAEQPAS